MKRVLPAVTTTILFSIGAPVLAQGFIETIPGFGPAAGVGAGVGAGAGKVVSMAGNSAARQAAHRKAANTYIAAVRMQRAGKPAEAAALLASFATQRQRLYGIGDKEVLRSYDNAAALATRAGKKLDAERYMRCALAVCKGASGPNSADVLLRMDKLGDTLPAAKTPAVGASSAARSENAAAQPDPTQTPAVPSDPPADKP